jgi:hypothetical protein
MDNFNVFRVYGWDLYIVAQAINFSPCMILPFDVFLFLIANCKLIWNWWVTLYYHSAILSNMNGWLSKNDLYNTLVLQREKKNWVNFQTNELPWVVFTIGKRLKDWGKVGGLPYKLWSITIFWSRKIQSIFGLCKEQKIQSQKMWK